MAESRCRKGVGVFWCVRSGGNGFGMDNWAFGRARLAGHRVFWSQG